MQLKLTCSVCDSQYNRRIEKLKADPNLSGQFLDVAISAVLNEKPKNLKILKEASLGSKVLVKYSCGHSHVLDSSPLQAAELVKKQSAGLFESLTKGYHAYPYQVDGVKFGQDSRLNCLIADEMGLGKTVQAALLIRAENVRRTACNEPRLKFVIIIKQSTIYQWIAEVKEWTSQENLLIQPVLTSKSILLPVFDGYLISMDLLPDVLDKLIPLKLDLVIADEVQSFKNPTSKRSKALVKLIQDGAIEHKIFLSGTPIKNRASEYFTVLNLLAPGHFPSYRQFVTRWLEPNEKGIPTRIRRYALDDFRRLTSRWIIRRELSEVNQDLPEVRYSTTDIQITDPILKKSYNQQLDLFSNWLRDSGNKSDNMGLLGWLARLRHETESAKQAEVVELAKDFLDSTDRKLAIGIHHNDVKDALVYSLEPYGTVQITGAESAQRKYSNVQQLITDSNTRVCIINELAGGVGTDGLQRSISDVFVLARQWSPADEEQFIKRFHRDGQTKPVNVVFMMAHGTIDMYFHQIIEQKKAILKDAYGSYDFANDNESMRQLADLIISNRL